MAIAPLCPGINAASLALGLGLAANDFDLCRDDTAADDYRQDSAA